MAADYAKYNTEYEVVGGYLSPVSDAYRKAGLASADHRVAMTRIATEQSSKWLDVDPWEAVQKEYQPTAVVLDHFEHEINVVQRGIESGNGERKPVRIVLLAGADLIQTMSTPGVWSQEDLNHILGKYGVFIVERTGTDIDDALAALTNWRQNIWVIQQLIQNDVSSTKVRLFLKREMSVRYLIPAPVIKYIEEHGLYEDDGASSSVHEKDKETKDDLFDDDFTPIDEPFVPEFVQPPQPQTQRGRLNRGRGGRGRARATPNTQHQHNTVSQPPTTSSTNTPNTTEPITATNEEPSQPTEPVTSTPSKASTSVRGDRSLTGGPQKPKLTEEELSARLAAAKLNSAKREEAHRVAEADEASFQQREAQASQRRQEEGRARRLMDQERERNRLRKLGAQGGREWDEGKEEQAVDSRLSQYRRGAHGGGGGYQGFGDRAGDVEGSEVNGYAERGFGDRGYGPRGGRGGRGGRGRGRGGRGRGGYDNAAGNFEILQPPVPDAEADFPALPSAGPPNTTNKDPKRSASDGKQQPQPNVEVPAFQPAAGGGQSWADEVEGKDKSDQGEKPATGW
ncbi:MAG: hypothetical protein Q9212_005657 [Teloschistes hypoglaucus]